ncbi:MAG: sigma-70 family RNA polymerase sigma factor [Eubacteriales bacterium]|nr:sigma-70 family RNA polymerase sigma factor [Eubacteriales bacterium]
MSYSELRTNEEITRIYGMYADTVYRICALMLKNVEETQDAVQNVFIKYMKCDKPFENDEHIKAWLIVTAKNECRNLLKHWWHSKRSDIENVSEPEFKSNNPSDGVLVEVLKLPDKFKLPLYLHYYEGYTTAEIAGLLKVNESTLRTRLVTARKQLKLLLEVGENA